MSMIPVYTERLNVPVTPEIKEYVENHKGRGSMSMFARELLEEAILAHQMRNPEPKPTTIILDSEQ